jgi:hypothetical protein
MIELKTIYDSRQSFYKKAMIDWKGNIIKLYSYDTLVLIIDVNKNKYYLNDGRLWSNTTTRHIKETLHQYLGLNYTSKEIIKNDGGNYEE